MFAASGQVRATVSLTFLAFAEPPLLRFAFDALLFAFQLRGEQFALFALPRKRRACGTSPFSNHVLAFQGLSPNAEVDATPVDFHFEGKGTHKIRFIHTAPKFFQKIFILESALRPTLRAACSGFVALAALLRLTCQSKPEQSPHWCESHSTRC